jgi:uncharacterized protein
VRSAHARVTPAARRLIPCPMNITHFTPVSALAGGALIGLAATLLLFSHGRIAGISGIWGDLFLRNDNARRFRLAFVAGLVGGAFALAAFHPAALSADSPVPLPLVAIAGLLVGIGTRLGNGCTSGHGVCGISRRSPRSLLATLTFMAAGFVTVWITHHRMVLQ